MLPLMMMWLLSLATAEITVNLQVGQSNGGHFEGQFCFTLPKEVMGWEIVMHFTGDVSGVSGIDGLMVKPATGCAREWTMVNKPYQGRHAAGQMCQRVSGTVCGGGNPAGSATLVDLTDGQHAPVAPHVTGAQTMKYNYAQVLQLSIMFYEAQRSGKLPASNRIPWRGDSALHDHGAGGEDLTGGWYDAGDNVKFNFPMAWSTTMLCWSLLEFPQAYEAAGETQHIYEAIRWPLEYFIKCHTHPNELYVQVGSGNADHAQWTRPEDMDQNRASFKIDASKPGSDVAMETAAAMACGSVAFKTKDAAFSATLLTHAKQLYTFGKTHQGAYSDSVPDAANFYRSQNYTDENNWGALWMYWATNDQQYLRDNEARYAHEPVWGFSWDEKIGGNHLLAYKFYSGAQRDVYKADIEHSMHAWSKAGGMTYSPKCLAFRLQWGALRYASNMAFMALVAAKYGLHQDTYRQWAMCQIHYALGDTGRSYLVGFGTNYPTQPHHRGASCPVEPLACNWDAQQNPGPNPHTIYGALVGGPGASDDYVDNRNDYIHNEVACDYNAGFQAANAGLLQLALDNHLPNPAACSSCPQP